MKLQPAKGTSAGEEMDMLTTLVEAYEEIHYLMQPSDPIAFLRYKMEKNNH